MNYFSSQNLYYMWFVSLLSWTSGSFSYHIPLALGEFLFTEHRVLARPRGICTVNLHWCWSAMANLTPNAVCVHWALSDQAKCRSGFNSCLALSCRRGSFFLLGFTSLTRLCGRRHQKPSMLHRLVLFNQSLTKQCCLDKLPKVKVTKRILSSRFGIGWSQNVPSLMYDTFVCSVRNKNEEKPTCSGLNSYLTPHTRKRFIWKSCACWLSLRD